MENRNELQKRIDGFREYYYSNLKNLLGKETISVLDAFNNFGFYLDQQGPFCFTKVHSGLGFRVGLDLILETIKSGEPVSDSRIRIFEAYLNQTRLPVRS